MTAQAELGVIGGTGFDAAGIIDVSGEETLDTPFGAPSGRLTFGTAANGCRAALLARHGRDYVIPPHRINYRANIWALHHCGCRRIIGVNAVGGIAANMTPSRLVIPDQLIDYTHSRKNTFFEDDLEEIINIDFTSPYSAALRDSLSAAAAALELKPASRGTYGVVQGPRLETSAEIDRMERDGCDIVGMTAMPEACLARELQVDYATLAVVANRAAGRGEPVITMEDMKENLELGMEAAKKLISYLIKTL